MTYCKIKGRIYKSYDKALIQTLLIQEDWNNFYNHSNPDDLWNILYEIISKHLNIMFPITFLEYDKIAHLRLLMKL